LAARTLPTENGSGQLRFIGGIGDQQSIPTRPLSLRDSAASSACPRRLAIEGMKRTAEAGLEVALHHVDQAGILEDH
jgi:hypothetical protein